MSNGPFTLLESALPIELNSASATVLAQIKVQFFMILKVSDYQTICMTYESLSVH